MGVNVSNIDSRVRDRLYQAKQMIRVSMWVSCHKNEIHHSSMRI